MSNVEIDEGRLSELARAEQFLDSLYRDPKFGMKFKALIKERHPNTSIPEIDSAVPIVAAVQNVAKQSGEGLSRLEKKFDAYLAKKQEEHDEGEFWKQVDRVVSENGLTTQGKDDLIKIMQERKIADPDAAAALLLRRQASAPMKPTGFIPSRWDFMKPGKDEKESMASLLSDPEGWFEEEATNVWNEVTGSGRRAA